MRKHPFTLLELLSVIVIIAVLAGILLGGMNYASRRADEAKTLAIMEEFATALEAFRVDRGYYPVVSSASEVELKKDPDAGPAKEPRANFPWHYFLSGNQSNKRPYMEGIADGDEIKDAYGNAFYYKCPGTKNPQKYDLWSKGPDGQHGDKKGGDTDVPANAGKGDDICNWKKR
jgi:type II secretion system protein G